MQETLDRDPFILLHDVARMLRTRADRVARSNGMTRAQWMILTRLARQPGLSQNELAAICEVEPITVGRLIDRLEAKGYVARSPDPMDRRVRRLKVQPAADAVLDEIQSYREEISALLSAGLPPHWIEITANTLLAMKEKLTTEAAPVGKAQASEG